MSEKLSDNAIQRSEVVTPAGDPPAGYVFEYFKNDGLLYRKNSAGVETQIGAGSSFESITITLNAAGTAATGGVLTNPGASPIITIPTASMLKYCTLNSSSDADKHNGSLGNDDGTKANCILGDVVALLRFGSDKDSIVVNTGAGDGWNGKISSISATGTSFAISFTKKGIGLAITSIILVTE